ncbi:MarR family winged helix-turn-helix transcriptional regulator [Marinomonas pollencensis]|uniref:MarR family transcriptional regulator n=1 Tax=Marinomonas pollencensis TaxID=491954 RepID=A0A3E0DM84_9GAMM|nr:MarR family transcriptional regulator [Marinomonas pollencensis]REG83803.1 MarR family transcriptional regulator [Marinomonas pollencensis]
MPQEKYAPLAMDLHQTLVLLHRKLKEKSHDADLNWSQKHVLRYLYRHSVSTISELAALEGVRTQSMGATVQSLKDAGYIVGQPDPKDGRKTLLSLTDDFVQKVEATLLIKEEWLQQCMTERLTEEEIHALEQALPALNKLVADA